MTERLRQNLFDLAPAGFDAFAKLELDFCALEVLFGQLNLKVDIPRQIILEETESQFEGDEPDGVVEIFFIVFGEEFLGVDHISPDEGIAVVENHLPRADQLPGYEEKYADEILKPQGLTKGTGVVDALTRQKLNELFSKQ